MQARRKVSDGDSAEGGAEDEDEVCSLKLSHKPRERALQYAGRKPVKQRRHSLDAKPVMRVATPTYCKVSDVELFDPRLFQGILPVFVC